MSWRALIMSAVVAGLLFPASAGAVTQPELDRAAAVGRTIWGDVCHGDVVVTVGLLTGSGGEQIGEARWDTDGVRRFACLVVVADGRAFRWPVVCGIVVHEYGHLAGRRHSRNPRSIMYPRLGARNTPRRCLVRGSLANAPG